METGERKGESEKGHPSECSIPVSRLDGEPNNNVKLNMNLKLP
jgi:hypothetical protein